MTMNQTFCVLYRAHIDFKKRVKQIGSWREIQTHRFDQGLNQGPHVLRKCTILCATRAKEFCRKKL